MRRIKTTFGIHAQESTKEGVKFIAIPLNENIRNSIMKNYNRGEKQHVEKSLFLL